MRKVELIFPDTRMLADFVLAYNINCAEVKSSDCILSAELPEDGIVIAPTQFGANVKGFFPYFDLAVKE